MDLQFLHFLITQIKVENKADKLFIEGTCILIIFFPKFWRKYCSQFACEYLLKNSLSTIC